MKNDLANTSKQEKRCVVRRVIFATLSVFCMVLIFMFSAKDADKSQEDSYEVGLLIGRVMHDDFSEWSEGEQLTFAKKIDHPVRKVAHGTEYAILGMLLVGAIYVGRKKAMLFAWIIAFLYAATDEIHQYFVPGRACKFTDVLIDSGGALFGILVVLLVISCRKERRKKCI